MKDEAVVHPPLAICPSDSNNDKAHNHRHKSSDSVLQLLSFVTPAGKPLINNNLCH